jgi:hypothetical protein
MTTLSAGSNGEDGMKEERDSEEETRIDEDE